MFNDLGAKGGYIFKKQQTLKIFVFLNDILNFTNPEKYPQMPMQERANAGLMIIFWV